MTKETTKEKCANCYKDIEEKEITFRDPVDKRKICEQCTGNYGYDCKIKKWGRDMTRKRWTAENTVEKTIQRAPVRQCIGCELCKTRAIGFGYREKRFIPLCNEHYERYCEEGTIW